MPKLEFGLAAWSMQSSYMRPRRHSFLYREAVADARRAEQLGFDVFWLGEHHHAYDGYLPSVIQAAAFLAASTSRIKLAAGVLVVPLHTAQRIAAACAAMQSICPRRLRLALGTGYWVDEFTAIGMEPAQRFGVFRRSLAELLESELNAELGATEIWSGQTSEAGVRRAARLGLPLYLPGIQGISTFRQRRDLYMSEFRPRRPGDEPQMHIFVDAWVDDDRGRAEWIKGRVLEAWRNYGINWLDVPGYTGAEPASGFAERLSQRDATAKAVTEGFIVGSARDVADAVGPYIEAGVNGVSFRVRFDGIDGRDVGRCIERIAAEVVPQLRRVHGGYRIDE